VVLGVFVVFAVGVGGYVAITIGQAVQSTIDAGNAPPLDTPAQVTQAVTTFLTQHGTPPLGMVSCEAHAWQRWDCLAAIPTGYVRLDCVRTTCTLAQPPVPSSDTTYMPYPWPYQVK